MRVVHLGKYYPPYRGGIETVVEETCRGLARRGVDVTAVVSNDEADTVDERVDGVRVIRLGRSAVVNSQPLNLGLIGVLRALEYDILHFHTPNPLGALALLLARRREPHVVSHHSDIVRQRLLGIPATTAQALVYRSAAAVLAATPKHIEYSPVLDLFRSNCQVIHYPIDASPYLSESEPVELELPPAWGAQPFLLFVGRLVYYKGVDVLLKAVASVPNVRLAIAGTGPLREQLERHAKLLDIADRVAFLGAVSGPRLRALYRRASFLVLPSVAPSEAFGMVQLEAMAAGRPVISTDLKSGVPYVNRHEQTGLIVPPSDDRALAGAIARLTNDPRYANELGERARGRILAEFHVERVVDAHMALYEAAISAKRA